MLLSGVSDHSYSGNTKVRYATAFNLGTDSINECNFLPIFHTTFGLAVIGKLALKLACISHPVLGNTKLRYGIGFTVGAFR